MLQVQMEIDKAPKWRGQVPDRRVLEDNGFFPPYCSLFERLKLGVH